MPFNAVWIVLPILTLLMFELGLNLRLSDFKLFAKRPRPVAAGLAGQLLVLPAVAFVIGWLFHLEPVYFVGLMLIACCPGGSSSNVFSLLAGGDVALSVSLTACSSVITLFTLPPIMEWVTQLGGPRAEIHLPVGNLLVQNVLLMFLPIVAGIALRKWRPRAAAAIDRVLSRLAFPALMLLAGIFFLQHRATIAREFGTLGAAVTLLLLVSMGCGALISRAARLSAREERTLIIEVGMQNAAQAIAIASSPFVLNNDIAAIPAIVYALMMNVVLLIYVAVVRRRRRS